MSFAKNGVIPLSSLILYEKIGLEHGLE